MLPKAIKRLRTLKWLQGKGEIMERPYPKGPRRLKVSSPRKRPKRLQREPRLAHNSEPKGHPDCTKPLGQALDQWHKGRKISMRSRIREFPLWDSSLSIRLIIRIHVIARRVIPTQESLMNSPRIWNTDLANSGALNFASSRS